jgi:hypothetical protein
VAIAGVFSLPANDLAVACLGELGRGFARELKRFDGERLREAPLFERFDALSVCWAMALPFRNGLPDLAYPWTQAETGGPVT